MLLRALASLGLTAALMSLVWMQIPAAHKDGYLTVEQLAARGVQALSFDRHFAMPIDFCILAPFAGLVVFLSMRSWGLFEAVVTAAGALVFVILCMYVLWIGGTEAHVHDHKPTEAGWYHGIFAAVVIWALAMLLIFTKDPQPVLLLVAGIVVPAFLFVGTHKFLGMINYAGAATTLSGDPLRDIVGWAVVAGGTAIVWWRVCVLIPAEFWDTL